MFELFNELKVDRSEIIRPHEYFDRIASLQDRAISDKDSKAISALDEAVQLWNSMWKADQIHDQTISDNVKRMQGRCSALLTDLHATIEKLLPGDGTLLQGAQRQNKARGAALPPARARPRARS